jgi:hypothetical protein
LLGLESRDSGSSCEEHTIPDQLWGATYVSPVGLREGLKSMQLMPYYVMLVHIVAPSILTTKWYSLYFILLVVVEA